MEGVVDFHLRQIYAALADIDMCVTEFIRVNEHVMPRKVFTRTCPELLSENRSFTVLGKEVRATPIKVQLLGSHPGLLEGNAAKVAKLGAIGIDLSFGCPAKTVNRSMGGAILLDDTALISDIVSAVREAVPQDIPVSAKIRLGFNDRDSYLNNAKASAAAGANKIAVHARSKVDGYQPPAYWHYIADIRREIDIPVVANGEIWTLDDYLRCKEQSGCTEFMLGRGLLANPGLARQIRLYEEGLATEPMSWGDVLPYVNHLFESTSKMYPSKHMGNRGKQRLHYLARTSVEAERLFANINREISYEKRSAEIKASQTNPQEAATLLAQTANSEAARDQ